jgi:hypothetical protein
MELSAEAIGIIGVVVAGAVQGLKQFAFPKNYALLACAVLALGAELFYVWSQGTFSRQGAWSLLAGFFAIYSVAVATYETIKTSGGAMVGTGDGGSSGGPNLRTLMAFALIPALAAGSLACGGNRYVKGTSVSSAIAYEFESGLTPLVDAQAQVIAAVDANPSFKPQADKFLNPVRDLLKFSKAEVVPRLKQLDTAIKIGDLARQGQLRGEIGPLIEDVNKLVNQAFGAALPDHVVASSNSLVRSFKSLEQSIRDVVTQVRKDLQVAQ